MARSKDIVASFDRASIFMLNNGSFWNSPNNISAIQMAPEESQTIANVMNSEDVAPFQESGIGY